MTGTAGPGGRFAGEAAVVTGGASGIGAALVALLRREGARVAVLDRAAAPVGAPAPDLHLQIDVTQERGVVEGIGEIEKCLGPVGLLANCAGIALKGPLIETSLDRWNAVVGVNLTGTFLVSREVARRMAGRGRGAIVNVASVDAHAADPDYGSYNASKAGILGVTRSFAIELAARGVRVNSVSPGLVLTPMIEQGSAAKPATRDHILHDFLRVPMRRVLRPEEVASACAYLLSDEASAVTGTDLVVDGGMLADSFLMNSLPG